MAQSFARFYSFSMRGETLGVEAPSVKAPSVEMPDVETPNVETPNVEMPDVEIQNRGWFGTAKPTPVNTSQERHARYVISP
ncbi:hypothetical protein V5R04_04085 [Jonesiaceae bacterium BS-20]|uniref:Uncharacterized protein n=1 Tax=Jonesiaceae bacterium BS-20 TaxID=3120821 RepID=A0AAU7DYQ2_9MICO